ncbi:MAG: hypothetical protein K940chlam2_01202 [Chlamydiae bacterium]|nr:hypothetical protein [Chlamydiota bacterium]
MRSLTLFLFTALMLCAAPRDGESMIMLAYHKNIANAGKCTPPSAAQEKKLFSEINAKSRQLYSSFDCEGKNRAMRYTEQKCTGADCTIPQCEGTGKCTFKDKNEAVQQAAKDGAPSTEEVDPRYQNGEDDMQNQVEQHEEDSQGKVDDAQKQMQEQDTKKGAQGWGY